MNRSDLSRELLNRVLQDTKSDIKSKINELYEYCGHIRSNINLDSVNLISISNVWCYGSADSEIMMRNNSLDVTKFDPECDIYNILKAFFSHIPRQSHVINTPYWFWNTPLGYACKVAQARCTLDEFRPVSISELAILADRKHTTIQQHYQRENIEYIKKEKFCFISPIEALRYLQSIGVDPFANNYNLADYINSLSTTLIATDRKIINSEFSILYNEY